MLTARVTSVMLAAGLAVGGMSVAEAKTSKTRTSHKFTATAQAGHISHTGRPPAPGSTSLGAGLLRSSLGSGAATSKITFGAGTGPRTYTFAGTGSFFTAHGSFRASFKGAGAMHSDGTITYSATGSITGGTDRYAGAKGKLSFTGFLPSITSTVDIIKYRGSITY
jgi:hypothetical protein